jgi:hypothetical protein
MEIAIVIGKPTSAEQAQASAEILPSLGMAAIRPKFVILRCLPDVLRNTAAVLKAESKIVCPIRITVIRCACVIFCRKFLIPTNSNPTLKAETEIILTPPVTQFRRHPIVFRCPFKIHLNSQTIFKTPPNVIHSRRVFLRRGHPKVKQRPLCALANSLSEVEADAEAVCTVRIPAICRSLEIFSRFTQIQRNSSPVPQTPAEARARNRG